MFIRNLYEVCRAGSGERNGFAARWYWAQFDNVSPNEHEGLRVPDSLKYNLGLIKFKPSGGTSIKISSTGTLHCNMDDDRYNISSHTPKIVLDHLSNEERQDLKRRGIPDFITPIFTYKQLKKGESNSSYPDIVVDLTFHVLNQLEITAKKFGLPLREKSSKVMRSMEYDWTKNHGPMLY